MYNIENSMVRSDVRSWEWDRFDEERVPPEDNPFIDWEADNFEEYGAPYDYYED